MRKTIHIKVPKSESFITQSNSDRSELISEYRVPSRLTGYKQDEPRIGSSASSTSSKVLNTVTLCLDTPSSPPSLLERFWNFNNIKQTSVIKSRCAEEYPIKR
jgi:hypothetical protein